MQDTFYKFMSFGPHTRLSLYMLFKHKSLFFAYKNVLNDPTDCSPYFFIELNKKQIESRIKEIASDTNNETKDVVEDALKIIDLFAEEKSKAPETKSATDSFRARFFNFGYFAGDSAEQIGKKFLTHHMKLQVDEARIFSMSKTLDEPRLWAHYGDSHSGLCLELDGLVKKPEPVILDRVDYTTRRPRISVNDVKGMNSHEETRKETLNRMFFQKSNGWDYEDEQRLVLPKVQTGETLSTLRFPEGDYIPFNRLKVKAIHFGMNCSKENMQMVMSLIDQFYKKSKPTLTIAQQNDDNYNIDFREVVKDEIRFWL